MVAYQVPFLRALRRRLEVSDRFVSLRFYTFYFRWPVLLALLALAGEKVIFYGALPLETWTVRKWDCSQARHDFALGRDQEALFHVRQALLEDRSDAGSWLLAGKISDRFDSPEAPYCWEQADRLQPGQPATELALARSALNQQEWELAGAALRELPAEAQNGLDFFIATGQLAEAEGRPARTFFEQAEALRPQDVETRFALAEGYASLPGSAGVGRACAILNGLAAEDGSRLQALRKLVELGSQVNDPAAAREAEARLLATPGADCADRMRGLDMVAPTEVPTQLRALFGVASREDAPLIVDWMATHGRAEEALIWVRNQDEAWQDDPGIGLARAGCLAALGEWTHLRDDQRDSLWPGHESTRLRLLAEASWRLGNEGDAKSAWHRAVAACADLADFTELAKTAAAAPQRDAFQTEVWLALANRYPNQQWPLRRLLRADLADGDLVMAEQVAGRLAQLAPDEAPISAARDLLCLLQGHAVTQAAADLAHLDAVAPGDPTVATGAAYALYLEGHFDDALAALGPLTTCELHAPERALYVGQLLAAAGPVDQADLALQVAQKETGLPDTQRHALERALNLVAYRRAMADLLQTGDPAAAQRARDFFLERAPTGEPVFVIGATMALLPDRGLAAVMLARLDGTALDRVELELEEGAVLALAGPVSRGASRLQLANGLPAETPLAALNGIVSAWWEMADRSAFDSSFAGGLLSAYRGLENAGAPADFWLRDGPREMSLTRGLLQSGALAGAVQTRLEALLRHVPATPELEAQIGYALFLQGRVEAGRERLEILGETERRRPEPALYYAAILRACGEPKRAEAYALLASREVAAQKAF